MDAIKECECEQIHGCNKTISGENISKLEEEIDLFCSQGWKVKSMRIEEKNGGIVLFIADLVYSLH